MQFEILVKALVGDERHEVVRAETVTKPGAALTLKLGERIAHELIQDGTMNLLYPLELPSPHHRSRLRDLGLLIEQWENTPPKIVASLNRLLDPVVGVRCLW